MCFIRAASYGCCLLAAYPVSSPAAVFASASWAALPVGGRLEGPPELFLGRLCMCAAASRTLSSALPPYLPTLTTHVPMLADAIGMSRRCFGGGALEWVLDRHIVGGRTPVCGLSVVCDGLIETDNIMWLICRLWSCGVESRLVLFVFRACWLGRLPNLYTHRGARGRHAERAYPPDTVALPPAHRAVTRVTSYYIFVTFLILPSPGRDRAPRSRDSRRGALAPRGWGKARLVAGTHTAR